LNIYEVLTNSYSKYGNGCGCFLIHCGLFKRAAVLVLSTNCWSSLCFYSLLSAQYKLVIWIICTLQLGKPPTFLLFVIVTHLLWNCLIYDFSKTCDIYSHFCLQIAQATIDFSIVNKPLIHWYLVAVVFYQQNLRLVSP